MTRSGIILGAEYTIECAVRADGSQPAREFLDALKGGTWDPTGVGATDADELLRDYNRLMDVMAATARIGVPPVPRRDVNYLRDGLWEFKVFDKRLVFYDTDGRGRYTPKPRVSIKSESPDPDDDAGWWFPEFDRHLRLANAWPKVGPTADPLDIDEASRIRDEDLSYDN